ncbi:MAG TPA: response regulator [Kofleriaceae bacterium]
MSARILVVDDSPFTGEAVAWALRRAGFTVEVARDLWDLEKPDLVPPDLVFMDVVLQEAFGDDLAMLLRGVRGFECPIVLLSSLPDHLLERRAADAELDGYISKRSGLAGIVARARQLLGGTSNDDSPAAGTAGLFEVTARQRVRRIMHIASTDTRWNASAISGEAHALAGDADLAGATAIAEAARACRDAAQRLGQSGATAEIGAAVQRLAAQMPDARVNAGIVLVVTSGPYFQGELLPELDALGFTVVEAQSLVELRPKLHASEYDLIIVDEELAKAEPTMIAEIGKVSATNVAILRDAPGEVDGKPVLSRAGGAKRIAEAAQRLAKRSA